MNEEEDGISLDLTDFNMTDVSGGFMSELFESPSSCVEDADPSWIQQIETMLFNEDNIVQESPPLSPSPSPLVVDDFFADLDFPKFQEEEEAPPPPPKEHREVTVEEEILCDDNNNCGVNNNTESGDSDKTENWNSTDEKKPSCTSSEDKDNDPLSKKRKRQMRNRDAAVKSRERKKMYVKDLEMKSKYLEGECIRLQRLLQYCSAENHALHLQLQLQDKAASRSKQESAVLLLESLLLGSLLWFLGMLALFSPLEVRLHLPAASELQSVDSSHSKLVDLVALGRAKSKSLGFGALRLFFKSKRCKASRSRMKFLHCNAALLAAC